MGYFSRFTKYLRTHWKDYWLIWALAVLTSAGLVITTILGYWQRWAWTGLETKSAWDWLELLIIPAVLAIGGYLFSRADRKSEREIAQDRVQEEALQRYLDRMQELILDKGLRRSKEDEEIREMRSVSRARTLTVLRSLDGNRKGELVRFLHEADLIGKAVREKWGEWRATEAIIDLSGANLRNANLREAILRGADLSDTNLSGADLFGANLLCADLSGANLKYAYMDCVNLTGAKGCTNEQLAQAEALVGATMPDGTKMTRETYEKFAKLWGQ
jgi:hypothetical protein